jgi:hypothetical protein
MVVKKILEFGERIFCAKPYGRCFSAKLLIVPPTSPGLRDCSVEGRKLIALQSPKTVHTSEHVLGASL